MNKHPILYKLLGLFFLIIPTVIYLIFLVPQLSEEYNILMSSAGILGGSGFYASSKIPETFETSGLIKLASKSFTLFVVVSLVEKFIMQILFLCVTIVISYIVYKIFDIIYKKKKKVLEDEQLANKITSSIVENIK